MAGVEDLIGEAVMKEREVMAEMEVIKNDARKDVGKITQYKKSLILLVIFRRV